MTYELTFVLLYTREYRAYISTSPTNMFSRPEICRVLIRFAVYNIRTYHECGVRIEKSVPRIAVWHHEACRVMTNGDPKGTHFSILPSHE